MPDSFDQTRIPGRDASVNYNTHPRFSANETPALDWNSYESFISDRAHWQQMFSLEQIELLDDMVTCIDALELKIRAMESQNIEKSEITKMLEKDVSQLRGHIDTFRLTEQKAPDEIVTEDIKTNLNKNSTAFKELQDLKTTARDLDSEASAKSTPEARQSLKSKLQNQLNSLIDTLAETSEQGSSAKAELAKDIDKLTAKEDSGKRGLNVLQKVVVWFNLKVMKRDGKWLKNYMEEQAFKDEKDPITRAEKINAYLEDNYASETKEIRAKEQKEAEEKAELARLKATSVEKTAPKAEQQTAAPLPAVDKEAVQAKTEQAQIIDNMREHTKISSILEVIGNNKENPLARTQEKLNLLLTEIGKEEIATSPDIRIRLTTNKLINRILEENLPVTAEQVDEFFVAVTTRAEAHKEDAKYYQKLLAEIEIGKGTVKSIIEQRTKQYELLNNWYEQTAHQAKFELGLEPGGKENDPNEITKKQEELLTYRFLEQIVEQNSYSGAALTHADKIARFNQFKELADQGSIKVVLATNSQGYAVPTIIVSSEHGKPIQKSDGTEQKPKTAKQILNLLTGGSEFANEDELSPGYQFTLNTENAQLQMICLSLDATQEEAVKDDPTALDFIVGHEISHAINAVRKEAYYTGLEQRLVELTCGKGTEVTTKYRLVKELTEQFPDDKKVAWVVESYLKGRTVSEQDAPVYRALEKKLKAYKAEKKKPHILEQRKLKLADAHQNGWQGAFDEMYSLAKDPTYLINLNEAHLDHLDIKNEAHRATLGLMRVLNVYPEQYMKSKEANVRDALALNRETLANYLGIGLGNEMEEIKSEKILSTMLDALACDPADPKTPAELKLLHEIISKDVVAQIPTVTSQDFAANYINVITSIYKSQHPELAETYSLGVEKSEEIATFMQRLLAVAPGDIEIKKNILNELKTSLKDLGIELPYLEFLARQDSQQAMNFINLFLAAPNEEEYQAPEAKEVMELNPNRRAIHPNAILRHSAMHSANAFFYGGFKAKDRAGIGMGGKVGTNFRFRHPKDLGPNLLRFGNWNKKMFVDGFGIGMDEFRTDSNDGWEGLYFLTGLSIHKMPWLANVPNLWDNTEFVKKHPGFKMDKKAFKPDAIIDPGVDAYYIGVLKDIFMRVSVEKFYDPQAIVRLILEFGGFDYDYTGQPTAQKSTYSTKDDAYRANPLLANFIKDSIMTGRDSNREDLKQIRNRMVADTIIFEGKEVTVAEYDGNLCKAKVSTDEKGFTSVEYENGPDGKPLVIQEGVLKIGQITQNVIDEIKEIMVYGSTFDKDGNPIKKPKNKYGAERAEYDSEIEKFGKNWKRAQQFEAMAKLMMQEDARRRAKNQGTYTIMDLLNEIDSVQNAPMSSLIDDEGKKNQAAVDRLKKQSIFIGVIPKGLDAEATAKYVEAHSVDTIIAKDFLKEFSLARSQKVLTVGVWEKDFDYKLDKDGNRIDATNFVRQEIGTNRDGEVFTDEHSRRTYYKLNGKQYLLTLDPRSTQEMLLIREAKEVNLTKSYTKDAKLNFKSKQTGYNFELDPIHGMPIEILHRYYGDLLEYDSIDAKGNMVKVRGRKGYDTKEGQMFDDVYDTLTKYRMGRQLSFNYAVKLYQFDKFRDYSKMKMEYYMGILQIEDLIRKGVIAATIIGSIIPGLAFLVSPGMIIGTLLWSITAQPFLVRWQKGWASRVGAAIENSDEVKSMQGLFWKLGSDSDPTSFGELDLARASYETVKFKYRSVLKEFNNGAKWGTNIFANLFAAGWDKVSTKPF